MKNLFALGLVCASIGCTNSGPYYLGLDISFSPREKEMVYEVLAEWKEAADHMDGEIIIDNFIVAPESPEEFSIDTWDNYNHFILKVASTSPGAWEIKNRYDPNYTAYTEYWPNQRMVILTDLLVQRNTIDGVLDEVGYALSFRKLFRHEVGHILNLDHESDSTIMAAKIDWKTPDCIDQNTLDEFCDANQCGPAAHETCSN